MAILHQLRQANQPYIQTLSRTGLAIIGVILLSFLVTNVIFWGLHQQNNTPIIEPRAQTSERLSLATFLNQETALVVTLTNEIQIISNGTQTAEYPFDLLVGGLIALPEQNVAYVGTVDGTVHEIDIDDSQVSTLTAVSGRIVGLSRVNETSYIVAHGIGPYSDQYWLTHLPYDDTQMLGIVQAEFTIQAVAASENYAYYGTANSRLGAMRLSDGEKVWTTVLDRPITTLHATDAYIYAGDEDGTLYAVNTDGEIEWQTNITPYPLRTITTDIASELIFAGDSNGTVNIVNFDGSPELEVAVAEDDIASITDIPSGQKIIIPRNGVWQTLNPDAIASTNTLAKLVMLQLWINVLLSVALLLATIYTLPRWRNLAIKLRNEMWHGRTGYLLLLPAVILVILFGYYPAFLALFYSFTNFQAGEVAELVGFENYIQIITEDRFFRVGFQNMFILIIFSILKTITLPLLIAELIYWLKSERSRYIFRTLYILPAVVPGLVIVYMWRMVYDPYDGLLNNVLALFGVTTDMAWLANEQTALMAIIFAGFPYITAFPLLIYMGGLLNINREMFEAARIDGANWWQRFWNIDFPLLRPQTLLLIFFAFNAAVSGYEHIFVYTRGGPGITTYVPGLQMYYRIADGDFGYASAIGTILFAIVFIGTLTLFGMRRFFGTNKS